MERIHKKYEDILSEILQDEQEALAYLNEALLDEDHRIFLIALKRVLAAQNIDISKFAQIADITRPNIYRILSKKGNPRWENLTSLLQALDLQIHLTKKENAVPKKTNNIESLVIDKKLYRSLMRQATKQGITVSELAHEKLSRK